MVVTLGTLVSWKNWGSARSLLSRFTFFPFFEMTKVSSKRCSSLRSQVFLLPDLKIFKWEKEKLELNIFGSWLNIATSQLRNAARNCCWWAAVGLTKVLFWNAAECVSVGYIRFEPFWGHFWTGFQIDDKASAINLNARELTEKLANWRRNKKGIWGIDFHWTLTRENQRNLHYYISIRYVDQLRTN